MPGTTSNYGLRYPTGSDAPDGPGGIYNLASDVDSNCARQRDLGGINLASGWNVVGSLHMTKAGRIVQISGAASGPSGSQPGGSGIFTLADNTNFCPADSWHFRPQVVNVGGNNVGLLVTYWDNGNQILRVDNYIAFGSSSVQALPGYATVWFDLSWRNSAV